MTEKPFMIRLAETFENGYHKLLGLDTKRKDEVKIDIGEELATSGRMAWSGAKSLVYFPNTNWTGDMENAMNGNKKTDEELQTLIRTKGSFINGDFFKGNKKEPEDFPSGLLYAMGFLFLILLLKK